MELENFDVAIDADGIALVTFDVPGRAMNVITQSVQQDLFRLAERIGGDPAIRGAVILSGKVSGFCAGADLVEMEGALATWRAAVSQDELRAGVESAGQYARALRALETCGKPVVAGMAGLALGGGLELALACHHRVASDASGLKLALPEAGIGLMPGGGATQRLPRLVGLEAALPHLLQGNPIAIDAALASAVLGAVVPADTLIDACRRIILDGGSAVAAWDRKGFKLPGGGPNTPMGYRTFPFAVARQTGETGDLYPAKANILRAVYEGSQVPIDAGLRIESRYFFNTVRTRQAGDLVRLLFAGQQKYGKLPTTTFDDQLASTMIDAWRQEAGAIVTTGMSPRLVSGVARNIGGWAIDLSGDDPDITDWNLVSTHILTGISDRLLHASGDAARSIAAAQPGIETEQVDYLAVKAGFPAWTGGPLSYLSGTGPA